MFALPGQDQNWGEASAGLAVDAGRVTVSVSAVFAGAVFEFEDDRFDYGEVRNVTIGMLYDAVVVIVWADREGTPHIISMRKATKGESDEYFERLG